MKLAHIFRHDLASLIQFSVILNHLKDHHNTVLSFYPETVVADESLSLNRPVDMRSFDRVYEYPWRQAHASFYHYPSTAAVRHFFETLCIVPRWEWLQYKTKAQPPQSKILTDLAEIRTACANNQECVAIWTNRHPIHFIDHSPESVLHLVPTDHPRLIEGEKRLALQVFERRYRYRVCKEEELNELHDERRSR